MPERRTSSVTSFMSSLHFSGKVIMASVLFGFGLLLVGAILLIIATGGQKSSPLNLNEDQLKQKSPMIYVGPGVMGVGAFFVIVGTIMCLFETRILRRRKNTDHESLVNSEILPTENVSPQTTDNREHINNVEETSVKTIQAECHEEKPAESLEKSSLGVNAEKGDYERQLSTSTDKAQSLTASVYVEALSTIDTDENDNEEHFTSGSMQFSTPPQGEDADVSKNFLGSQSANEHDPIKIPDSLQSAHLAAVVEKGSSLLLQMETENPQTAPERSENSLPVSKENEIPLPVSTDNDIPLSMSRDNEISLPKSKDMEIPLPVSTDNEILLPESEDKEMLLPTSKDNEISLPVSTNNEVSLPVSTNNEILLPESKDKEMLMPTSEDNEIPLPMSTGNEIPLVVSTDNDIPLPMSRDNEISLPESKDMKIPLPVSTDNEMPLPESEDKEIILPTSKDNEIPLPVSNDSVPKAVTTHNNVSSDDITKETIRPVHVPESTDELSKSTNKVNEELQSVESRVVLVPTGLPDADGKDFLAPDSNETTATSVENTKLTIT